MLSLIKNSYKSALICLIVVAILFSCNISFAENVTDKNISQDNVVSTAKNLNSYINKEDKLPTTVNCDGNKLTIPEFTYLMSKTIEKKKNNDSSDIILKKGIKYPNLPIGDDINKNIYLKDYNSYAFKINKYIDTYNKLPNYLSDNGKKIQYQTYVLMFTKVLSSSSSKLPDKVHLNVKKTSNLNKYSNPYIKGNGLWLWSQYMNSVNFKKLKDAGIGNIFLLESAISQYGLEKVVNFAKTAHKYNIKVHIWFCTFKVNGKWINPIDTKTKSYNYAYFNTILKRVDKYSKIKAFDGIHFDYVRYSGVSLKASDYNYSNGITGDKAITKFVKMAKTIAKKNNNKIILSAALMPEPNRSIRLYGQNTKELGKHLDVLIPMVYKFGFGKNNKWITDTTKWYKANSNGAKVWIGLEVYGKGIKSLSPKDMIGSAKAATKGGADGLTLFRYKLWKVTNILKAY